MTRQIHELVFVEVGAVGVTETTRADRTVTLDLDIMSNEEIGRALAEGYREASKDAVAAFAPHLSASWREQADRIERGDG